MTSSSEYSQQPLPRSLQSRLAFARPLNVGVLLLVSCAALGVLLRLRGVATIPLWLDEAQWAHLLLRDSWLTPSIRPLGFMGLSQLSVHLLGATELSLRLLPCLAGVATALLSVPLASLLFRGRAAQLLFVASLTLHPLSIDYSKEFKPYALSLLLHLSCLFFALRYVQTGRLGSLLGASTLALIGPLFAQDVVFALPGVFLVLGLCALREGRRLHLVLAVVGAASCLLMLFALYWFAWRKLDHAGDQSSAFWGGKYDVFYLPGRGGSRLGWVLEKCRELAAFPGSRRERFQALGPISEAGARTLAHIDAWVWLSLQVLGLGRLLLRRQRDALLLLVMPLLVWLAFNQLGYWPFGAFRTNLFALAYVCPLAGSSLETRSEAAEGWWSTIAAAALVFVPLLAFERDWHAHKPFPTVSSFGTLADELVRRQGSEYSKDGDPLVLDAYSCSVWYYYLRLHPRYRVLASDLERRFRPRCAQFGHSALTKAMQSAHRTHRRAWLVLMNPEEIRSARQLSAAQPGLEVHELDDHSALVGSFRNRRSSN